MPDSGRLFEYSPIAPGDAIRQRLKEKGWTHEEFAVITGKSRRALSDLISGKSGLTPEMAVAVAAALGDTPADWLKLDIAYRLRSVNQRVDHIKRFAELFSIAPIKDMQRRGWIKDTDDPAHLEEELKNFFGTTDLTDDLIGFSVAPRRSSDQAMSPAERAWCAHARRLAIGQQVGQFQPSRLGEAKAKLRALAAYVKEARYITATLAAYGIRFVVVEPLPGMKVDGAAFWIDKDSPVIAVSIRFDRIDAFWFTVLHELEHIKNGDALSVDSELVAEDGTVAAGFLIQSEAEERANRESAATLIAPNEMDSFIRRVGPLYSKQRIIQFAHRIKMHPGIIVGQLQKRGEVGYSAHREMLVKIRPIVVETAITDGWGESISPESI